MKGIDVSKWQGNIDFNKVKAAGIQFVIIRAGYCTYAIRTGLIAYNYDLSEDIS